MAASSDEMLQGMQVSDRLRSIHRTLLVVRVGLNARFGSFSVAHATEPPPRRHLFDSIRFDSVHPTPHRPTNHTNPHKHQERLKDLQAEKATMLVQVQKLDAQVKEDGAALGQKPRDTEQVGGWTIDCKWVDGWMDGWIVWA
jgi:hypothetical protein